MTPEERAELRRFLDAEEYEWQQFPRFEELARKALDDLEREDEWAVETTDLEGDRLLQKDLTEAEALEMFFHGRKADEGLSELSALKPKLLHRSVGPWVECTKDHWELKE